MGLKGQARASWGADNAVSRGPWEKSVGYEEPPLHTASCAHCYMLLFSDIVGIKSWRSWLQSRVLWMGPVAFPSEPLAPYQPSFWKSPCEFAQTVNRRCKLDARTF